MTSGHHKPQLPLPFHTRVKHALLGPAKNLHDPALGHNLSLIAFLAWVGLGADGLSSSAYGPEEAFRALGSHTYLSIFLVLATALTVFIISYAYSCIIERFPTGGGGYVVATKLLGKPAGVVSGCALFVDYILTITVSIAGGGDALFSLLPPSWMAFKLPIEFGAILFLIMMNLRGVKESVSALIPIFITFIITHIILIFGGIFMHLGDAPAVIHNVSSGFHSGLSTLGAGGLFFIFLRAYSLGGGTYTGIEAVSNGLGILRDPKVETGKRTMFYMSVSLAVTAGGLLLCYMLADVRAVAGQTLNTVLATQLMSRFYLGPLPVGHGLMTLTILAEAILLLVAAQTGFIDGPRVMANMAQDSWVPRRFAALSDRLTMQNGILLIGLSAIVTLAYTQGHIGVLVVMYSINVFVTFSLSEIGMVRFWISQRKIDRGWFKQAVIQAAGFVLCFSILCVMIVEKFTEGAWLTLVITAICIRLCFLIKGHYFRVAKRIHEIDRAFQDLPIAKETVPLPEFDPKKPTAVILVGGHSGLGTHILLNIFRLFPKSFKNVVFLTVGVVDSDFFKDSHQVTAVIKRSEEMLKHYVEIAQNMGIPARSEFRIGTEVVQAASELCLEISQKLAHTVYFAGELVFEKTQWYHRIFHNETAYAILRQIRFAGLPMVILPIRITSSRAAETTAT